jgi:putative flippase GtrA
MHSLLLYAGVGVIGTAIHYATLLTLVGLPTGGDSQQGVLWATTLGAILGASANYVLNQRCVFPGAHRHRQALPRFATVAGLGLIINAATVAALTSLPVSLWFAQLGATALVLGGGYLLNRFWTFS